MPAYYFVDVLEITDEARIAKYREGVSAAVEKYGGRYLILGGKHEVVEGNWRPTFPVMIEFPTMEQAKAEAAARGIAQQRGLYRGTLGAARGNRRWRAGCCRTAARRG